MLPFLTGVHVPTAAPSIHPSIHFCTHFTQSGTLPMLSQTTLTSTFWLSLLPELPLSDHMNINQPPPPPPLAFVSVSELTTCPPCPRMHRDRQQTKADRWPGSVAGDRRERRLSPLISSFLLSLVPAKTSGSTPFPTLGPPPSC